jgi:hypothetical protein
MDTVLFKKEKYRSTYFLVDGKGVNRVLDFLMKLSRKKPNDYRRIRKWMQRICVVQRPSKEHFNNEGDGVYAIKAYQIRVYGFYDGDRFIMCRAVEKKRNKADPKLIRLVKEDRAAYLEG